MGFDSTEVDPSFFQDGVHRPKPTISVAEGIPVIDLSSLSSLSYDLSDPAGADNSALSGLLDQIEAASRDWGFFQVVNHGVPPELLRRALKVSKEFFDLPPEEKRKVRRDEKNPYGYYEGEHTKNVRDWKEVFDFVLKEVPYLQSETGGISDELQTYRNQWPEHPARFREVYEEFARGAEGLAFVLLRLIALTLGLPANRLDSYFDNQVSFLRLNHYPPCPVPHLALGVGRHKDSGALTVLLEDDVGGLDVRRKSDGEWVRVQPVPDAFIINVGDIIQVWSNDKYESVEHRVTVNSERERFSIPFFFNPGPHVNVKPLEEVTSRTAEPARYEEYNWGEFFQRRNLSNFKKLEADNVQVQHFKKNQR